MKALRSLIEPAPSQVPNLATLAWRAFHATLCAGDTDAQLGSI